MADIEKIKSVLHRVRETNGGYSACCPAHEDRTPSLSFRLGDDGKVLFKCHGGCEQRAVIEALESLGVTSADFFEEHTVKHNGKPRQPIFYEYRDQDGNPRHGEKHSWNGDGKKVRQYKLVDGEKVWNTQDIEKLPYRLPEILASDPTDPIYVCEGPKDADNLAKQLKLTTTTFADNKCWRENFDQYFVGRSVIILPDNDENGIIVTAFRAAKIHRAAKQVWVVYLPDLPPKGDVSDWLEQNDHASADDLRNRLFELVHESKPWTPQEPTAPPEVKPEVGASPTVNRFETGEAAAQSYVKLQAEGANVAVELGLPEVDRAIGGGVERGEIVVIGAPPSHGKTAVALQCMHNATANGKPCLFISLEMSVMALGKRVAQFASSVPVDQWESDSGVVLSHLDQHHEKRASIFITDRDRTEEQIVDAVGHAVKTHGVEVIAIDYLQLIQTSAKSAYDKATEASKAVRRIASEFGVTVLALAQLNREIGKREVLRPRTTDLRDSGQIEQDADVILMPVWPYKLDDTKPKNEYLVYIEKNRNRETLANVVKCEFDPERQMLTPKSNDWQALPDDWNQRKDLK